MIQSSTRFLLGILLILFVSCGKDPVPHTHIEKGFEYLPLNNVESKIYKYTYINIDVVAGIQDTSIWFIRETITDTISDSLDYTLIRVEREKRRADTLPWEPATVLSYRLYDKKIVRVDENVPYIILEFPVKIDYTWNGNFYNTNEIEDYSYSNISAIDTIQGNIYDSVLVVTQNYFESLYSYMFKEERFAYGVGMISKKTYNVESQPNHANIIITDPILERITKGSIETYELIQ